MYESFYRFRAKPFSLVPDPEFLYLSRRHKPGLNVLEYGLLNRALFTVLTGEPGTGKTTLLNKILEEHHSRFTVGVIGTTHPNDQSLLPWVADAFGLDVSGLDTVGQFRRITAFLKQAFLAGRQVLLVVDEAQNLSLPTLEDLRLLSNLNDGRQIGLQIVLAGQPTLRAMLTRPDMRQFAQRITVDYVLEPLSEEDVRAYIRHRLAVVGGDPELFTEYAAHLVCRLSGGIPRLINQLCDLSLAYGFGEGAERITAPLVLQVASDRAVGGMLPSDVDPKAIQLDDEQLAREALAARHTVAQRPTIERPPMQSVHQPSQQFVAAHPYQEGLDLKQVGRYEEAVKKFEAAESDPAVCFLATVQQGLCLRSLGRLDRAAASFHRALEADGAKPDDLLNVRYLLAQTLEQLKRGQEAMVQYRLIYEANPLFRDVAERIEQSSDNGRGRGGVRSRLLSWWRSLTSRRR
ncbi:MAG: AAA family ATPase [Nitrospira sp.]|nr:AAA family ATPase [Nitrospira sp.]MCP9442336.1 AAA family ATPase [Nitrospira sp.]